MIGKELNSKHALMTSIWRFLPEQKIEHPAPFPLQLPLRCIYSILDDKKDCIVIDPYCGSGTSLLAAKMLKHQYIGIDISPKYIEEAYKRLNNWKSEENAFKKEIEKHFVKNTFDNRKKNGAYKEKLQLKNERNKGSFFDFVNTINTI